VRDFVLFALIVVAGTGGELCVSLAMKRVGEATSFHPVEILRVLLRALGQPWMWAGVAMMALGFFSLLGALSLYNVSFVVPVTALSYIAGAVGGAAFLKERVSFWRWIGVALVAAGVVIVVLSQG
jgi:drug/metabolite transporter (DMT)-like permease